MAKDDKIAKPIIILTIVQKVETSQQINQILSDEPNYEVINQIFSGAGGVEFFRTTLPDIVLIERSVRDMDSIEIVRQLKVINHDSRLIMMHDTGELDWMRKALIAGAQDFLRKPLRKSQLMNALNPYGE
jgi:DNA-binding NarL/FixJ family response regulator